MFEIAHLFHYRGERSMVKRKTRPLTWQQAIQKFDDKSVKEPKIRIPKYPEATAVRVRPVKRTSRSERELIQTDGEIPKGVKRTMRPRGIRTTGFRPAMPEKRNRITPGVVFFDPLDDRKPYMDRNYPWRAIGRVDTPAGIGTGFLVGPRHMMTASHVIKWNGDANTGFVQFRAGYNRDFESAGQPLFTMEAFAERVLFFKQVDGSRPIFAKESAWDFVVCVMDKKIGDELGYFGAIEYDDDWDDENFWGNAGYPLNLGRTEVPFFQDKPFCVLDEYDGDDVGDGILLRAEGDFTEGQSGSPVFATFNGDIKAIGLFSGGGTFPELSDDQGNFLPAGENFVRLIKEARNNHP
jgi:V8-like Glu-specific endopeptidase